MHIMLDKLRGGLDASSLHRATSMYNYKVEKFGLLSCHRDTLKKIYDITNKNTSFVFSTFIQQKRELSQASLCDFS